jgi:hypothetical protein
VLSNSPDSVGIKHEITLYPSSLAQNLKSLKGLCKE